MKYKLQLVKEKKKSTRGIRTREVQNTRNRSNHRTTEASTLRAQQHHYINLSISN